MMTFHFLSLRRDTTRAENPPLMGATERRAPHCLHCMYISLVACSLSSTAAGDSKYMCGPRQASQYTACYLQPTTTVRLFLHSKKKTTRSFLRKSPVSLLLHREHNTYSIMYFLSTFSIDFGWNRPLIMSLCFPSMEPEAPSCVTKANHQSGRA